MQIFLTGGTGFIGQALARAIRERGWSLRALVRDPASAAARWLLAQGAELKHGDVTVPEGLAEAVRGSDVLIHNAGNYEIAADTVTQQRMTQVNVDGKSIRTNRTAPCKRPHN
jgi:uncharacterized protein YbjT (DUF2867 family)